jgi:hypothetical protein
MNRENRLGDVHGSGATKKLNGVSGDEFQSMHS